MKVAIATVQIPFVSGGAEMHAQNLKTALLKAGHEAEIITMPFNDNPLYMLENYIVASRLMDINSSWGGRIDLCIGLKFPAYYFPHSNKVDWILHQHRQAYDLFDTEFSNIKNELDGLEARKIVYNADNHYLPEAKRIYTNSENVSKRLMKYNGIKSTPLYHPCPDMDQFYCESYEEYILMPSRINITKRQALALDAMSRTKGNFKLYIVGKADNPVERDHLLELIRKKGLEDRVRYLDYVSQEEKFKLYANAKAVLFIPLDEDYGYITLEAMASSKAVITATDSGGPLEFVEDDHTGEVVNPTAEDLARAMDFLMKSKHVAAEMGKNARRRLDEMEITWDHVVKELTR